MSQNVRPECVVSVAQNAGSGTRPGTTTGQSSDALGDVVAVGSKPPYLHDMGRFEGTEMTNPAG